MRPHRRQLPIDAAFDVAFADKLAHLETYNKHNYRPNTYLHKWWGRRCGSTFRLILKGLVEEDDRQGYYTPGGLDGKVILDPMMGGGTTLHEAIRLGASVMGVDVDPIPILQARATLTEYPLAKLEAEFAAFYDRLVAALGDQYRTHCPRCDEPAPFWYALYGLRRRCDCREVLVVDSLLLRHEPDGAALRWCPACGELGDGGPHRCAAEGPALITKRQTTCDCCGAPFRDVTDRPFYARYEMLAVAGHCDHHGLFHKSPDWRDRAASDRAEARRASLPLAAGDFVVRPGDKSNQLLGRNISSYLDLFSSRQLIFLNEVIHHLPPDDPILRINLALLVSTALEFNSMLCGYKGNGQRRAGAVRHTFAHHGYSFPYTALENNPVYPRRASGTLRKLFYSRIVRGRQWAAAPTERALDKQRPTPMAINGERDAGHEVTSAAALRPDGQRFFLRQGSAVALPAATGSIDAVVTDPPYYDSIQYGDLAAFFRVWLRQFVPDAAEWQYDGAAAAVSSGRAADDGQYTALMGGIFRECRRVLRPDCGRLIFTFHHWRPRAWAALTAALYDAGFVLLNHYVVHAEHPMSVHISKLRALTHDAILVLAPHDDDAAPRWPRPEPPDPAESWRFTAGCAAMAGWVLDQPDLSATAIDALWREALPDG
jgi:putative DNA methylase